MDSPMSIKELVEIPVPVSLSNNAGMTSDSSPEQSGDAAPSPVDCDMSTEKSSASAGPSSSQRNRSLGFKRTRGWKPPSFLSNKQTHVCSQDVSALLQKLSRPFDVPGTNRSSAASSSPSKFDCQSMHTENPRVSEVLNCDSTVSTENCSATIGTLEHQDIANSQNLSNNATTASEVFPRQKLRVPYFIQDQVSGTLGRKKCATGGVRQIPKHASLHTISSNSKNFKSSESQENAIPHVVKNPYCQGNTGVSKFKMPAILSTPHVESAMDQPRIPFLVRNDHGQSGDTEPGKAASYDMLPCQNKFFSVMYCVRKRFAKHKGPWFDGVLIVRGRKCTLKDTEGKLVCKGVCNGSKSLHEDATLEVSKYEVQVIRTASQEEYESGTLFTGCFESTSTSPNIKVKSIKRQKFVSFSTSRLSNKVNTGTSKSLTKGREGESVASPQSISKDAVILNTNFLADGSAPVQVDPYIATKLRPHQQEGVRFMYECVMGLRAPLFTGCLLADEMGLGKTLQVIALIWTFIHRNSGLGPKLQSLFKRIIVVCPSSLVQNWGNEVRKWLGSERLKPLVVHAGLLKEVEQKFQDFKNGGIYPLLITSYELLRKHCDLLASTKPGLLVCDEAHRLKNCAGTKTIDALLALRCPRKILLTGTPVQNDLNEFFAMVDFANPNLLGPLSAFKRLYADTIELSRDRNASEEQKQLGQARFLELQTRTKFCILRRTAAINRLYLPTKTEYLVFCRLQPLQVTLYEAFLKSEFVTKLFLSETSSANVLPAIGILRKLCNHPRLIQSDMAKETYRTHFQNCRSTTDTSDNVSNKTIKHSKSLSGKLDCLFTLLSATLQQDVTDRVVVVSNFTQSLNLVQELCESEGWSWLRLDGGTNIADRQCLVDRFNSGYGRERVFLLSSKAGGVGLNLVGASRLVLLDPDWNPATDAQAMARIWREGQKKPVLIYRLFSTGSIEEKIFQRQMVKGEIAATIENTAEAKVRSNGGRYFSRKELQELFVLQLNTRCDTYDLLSRQKLPVEEQWRDCLDEEEDPALKGAITKGLVSFVHKEVHQQGVTNSPFQE